jgi:hypothetical protein
LHDLLPSLKLPVPISKSVEGNLLLSKAVRSSKARRLQIEHHVEIRRLEAANVSSNAAARISTSRFVVSFWKVSKHVRNAKAVGLEPQIRITALRPPIGCGVVKIDDDFREQHRSFPHMKQLKAKGSEGQRTMANY